MVIETWLYYVFAVFILTASPGPSALVCLSTGVASGFKQGALTALGSLCAITLILTLSFTGLGVVITNSEWVFNFIKWLGAAYLVYLGVKLLLSKPTQMQVMDIEQQTSSRLYAFYVRGFLVGASNPKAILFFTALFPQFINPQVDLLGQYLVFACTFVVLELSWLLFYVYLGTKSSRWIFSKDKAQWFNRITGGVFIGAGTLLSLSNRA